jgi:hypothetical protein
MEKRHEAGRTEGSNSSRGLLLVSARFTGQSGEQCVPWMCWKLATSDVAHDRHTLSARSLFHPSLLLQSSLASHSFPVVAFHTHVPFV